MTKKEFVLNADLKKDFIQIVGAANIKIDLKYASEENFTKINLYENFNKAYLHKFAAKKFFKATKQLEKFNPDFKFVIYDALRPLSVQKKMWGFVKGTEQEKYVANPEEGSLHNYGLAIDLSILDKNEAPLDMGTEFDSFTPLSQPELEQKFLAEGLLTDTQILNRKILRDIMVRSGFYILPHEWWHFNAIASKNLKSNYKIVE